MTRIANLGIYDLPGTVAALDALWADVAPRLRAKGMPDVPDSLTRRLPITPAGLRPHQVEAFRKIVEGLPGSIYAHCSAGQRDLCDIHSRRGHRRNG